MSESGPILAAYGVSYYYQSRRVLDEVSCEIQPGDRIALIGPNGSGKSTLLKLLGGILDLTGSKSVSSHQFGTGVESKAGTIRIRNQEISRLPAFRRSQAVCYVGADLWAEFPITVEEVVMMGRVSHQLGLLNRGRSEDRERVESALKLCHCFGLRKRDLQTLSGGERQLVALARALAQGSRVILLDESLSRMDLNHQSLMGQLLKELAEKQGHAIVLVAHDVNFALEWTEDCLVLNAGKKLVSGKTQSVFTEDVLKRLYPGAQLSLRDDLTGGRKRIYFEN